MLALLHSSLYVCFHSLWLFPSSAVPKGSICLDSPVRKQLRSTPVTFSGTILAETFLLSSYQVTDFLHECRYPHIRLNACCCQDMEYSRYNWSRRKRWDCRRPQGCVAEARHVNSGPVLTSESHIVNVRRVFLTSVTGRNFMYVHLFIYFLVFLSLLSSPPNPTPPFLLRKGPTSP